MGYKRMRKLDDGYYAGRHSCFVLQYHLVLVTKYRRPVLDDEMAEFVKSYATAYFAERSAPIMQMEVMPDHVHVLFETVPNVNLGDFVGAFKAASSRRIRKTFADRIDDHYWKPLFWSDSYFIATVSERNTELVRRYIQNQKDGS